MENNNMDYLPKKKWWERAVAFALILAIIFITILAVKYFHSVKPKPKKRPPQKIKAVVETTAIKPENYKLKIEAIGIIKPTENTAITSEVSGKILYLSEKLIPGNLIKKGELIAKIDDRDYKAQVLKAKANLKKAEAELELEKGKQSVAKNELKLAEKLDILDNISFNKNLTLRQPQLLQIKASISLAKAELAVAENNLNKTKVYAPYDLIVTEKNISLGSYVNPSTVILKGVNSDKVWAEVKIPYNLLKFIDINNQKNKQVKIYNLNDHDKFYFTGKFLKILPEVDNGGLLATAIIEIDNPFADVTKPLLINNKVKAIFEGVTLNNVIRINLENLRDNNQIYLYKNGVLVKKNVNLIYSDNQYAYIETSLENDEKLIKTNIPNAIENMPLKEVELNNESK